MCLQHLRMSHSSGRSEIDCYFLCSFLLRSPSSFLRLLVDKCSTFRCFFLYLLSLPLSILSSLASFLSSMIPVCLVFSVWTYLLLSLSLRNGFFSVGRASVTPEETAEDMLCGNDWKLIFSAGLSTASY